MPVIKNRASFAEHAAPEAVAHYLRKAKEAAARANAEVRWLTELLAQKTAASEGGTQPTNGDTRMTDTIATLAEVETAINDAVTGGLPRPAWQTAGDNNTPFLNLGLATPADVDQWAAHVNATVGYGDVTYTPQNGETFHEYGTNSPGSVYGRWLGRTVYVSCQVPGPHPA